jgi:acyl-CoA thioesterase
MTKFSALTESMASIGDTYVINCLPADWLQGRTAYGGLSAALCLEATTRCFTDLPPLRSAQFCFVGPATGLLSIKLQMLRRGRSAVHVGAELHAESGLGVRATLCFGTSRPSKLRGAFHPEMPTIAKPDACPDYFSWPNRPNFTNHFDGRLAVGDLPVSKGGNPSMGVWLRHREAGDDTNLVRLLALADALPPAAAVLFEEWAPISTVTWSIQMLTEQPHTESGWWYSNCQAESVEQGYSTQTTTIWSNCGQPILTAQQTIAIFA